MSVALKTTPELSRLHALTPPLIPYRFSVKQFERMVEAGILNTSDRAELLEGWVVEKMTHNPPHATALDYTQEIIRALLPSEWRLREQKPINTADSQPEPDLAIVRGPTSRFAQRHPVPADVAMVVEVADASLDEDRKRKGRIYARARIPVYWIINLVESKVEVYTQPKGGKTPAYRERRDYGKDESVPFIIADQTLGFIEVRNLLPVKE